MVKVFDDGIDVLLSEYGQHQKIGCDYKTFISLANAIRDEEPSLRDISQLDTRLF